MRTLLAVVCLAALQKVVASPLSSESPQADPELASASKDGGGRKGRFLHITDLHPDPLYRWKASPDYGCHRKVKGVGPPVGWWGNPGSSIPLSGKCDSPPALIDTTFAWLKQHWHHEIDFVIWTGDNNRHPDDPEKEPTNLTETLASNREMAVRMRESFAGRVPIVPTLGNNDCFKHDTIGAGPNPITKGMAEIWAPLIPASEIPTVLKGAYFSMPVIPGRLAVVSLNTLYWDCSNKDLTSIRGCSPDADGSGSAEDPGTEEYVWLEERLKGYRRHGVKVYLIGHVPPNLYYPRCRSRYAQVSLEFQDVIVGHLFGHMNTDHFDLVSSSDILSPPFPSPDLACPKKTLGLAEQLRQRYERVSEEPDVGEFAVVSVAPSVIPTFQPAIRVWTYDFSAAPPQIPSTVGPSSSRLQIPFTPDAPSTAGVFTPLAYTQFYVRLALANRHSGYGPGPRGKELEKERGEEGERPGLEWEVEYTTATKEKLVEAALGGGGGGGGGGRGPSLFPKELAPSELRNVTKAEALALFDAPFPPTDSDSCNTHTDEEKRKKLSDLVPYGIEVLTPEAYLRLARRLVRERNLWCRYLELMAVSTDKPLPGPKD